MNLPIESVPPHRDAIGKNEGGVSWGGVAALEPYVEFMRFCTHCNQETRFIAQIEMLNGLFGCCANCGDESVAPYTRTVNNSVFTLKGENEG
jgi:hypothetical protein